MQRYALTLLSLLPLACGRVADPSPGSTSLREGDTTPQMYIHAHVGSRVWEGTSTSSGAGYVGFEFQSSVARILEHGLREGLISPPECGALEMPERRPTDWVGGIEITEDSIVVEVLEECEFEPPVPPEDPGDVDIYWEEGATPDYATYCAPTEAEGESSAPEGLGMQMACARLEEFDESATVTYPSLEVDTPSAWYAEGETDCEQETICRILQVNLWPADPATGSTQALEVSCADHPELCDIRIDLLDPTVLVSTDDTADEDEDAYSTECESVIEEYNAGGDCTAAVAECAADGACYRTTDEGYQQCDSDSVSTSCTTCTQTDADGRCEAATVEVENEDPDAEDLLNQGTAVNHFNRSEEDATGDSDRATMSDRSENGWWTPWTDGKCHANYSYAPHEGRRTYEFKCP